ncbi:TadE/TadG family type IV pilus assembly protein [Aestuariivirga litoralis]|uniref:TadE/TadG family type IV pilus assembly protein n=1 Tax=Aestuariivirga litoralis TaxID=2650924 RepID=UPI0018C49CDA|nr:TadE/TadG family type IV pilus assembly protein [Aestuariivirga litoralis]MBG1233949.1 pilus assembly protein [Aestuariivirga litoralis]
MKQMFKRFLKAQSGAAAVEAVLILPFLFILYFSLQDFTALVTFNRKITLTSATLSDTIAQYQTTVVRSDITDMFNAVGMIMQPTPSANVRVNLYGYYLNGTTPTIRWQANNGSGPTCAAPDTSTYATLMTSGNDLVVAVTCMNYTPWVATFFGQSLVGGTTFLLSQTIASRPRASATLSCVTTSGGTTACSS